MLGVEKHIVDLVWHQLVDALALFGLLGRINVVLVLHSFAEAKLPPHLPS